MNAALKNKIEKFYADNKAAVDGLAAYLQVPPLWLVCVWDNESGLNPAIQNSIGATGLNQMMPDTLQGLGLTANQYKAYSPAQQMTVMRQFFKPIKGRIKRAGDLYLFNFYPVAVIKNWDADKPIGKNGDLATRYGVTLDRLYDQNASLDYNGDQEITRRDFWEGFEAKYDELVKGNFFFRDLAIDFKTNWVGWVLVLVAVIMLIYFIVKKVK